MLRPIVKTSICRASHWIGMDRGAGGKAAFPVVIGYHRVVEDFPSESNRSMPPMLISTRMFEQHLDWIGKRYRFVSLDELGSTLEQRGKFDRPVAAVTFDDGYRDIYDNAFPILKRKGIPAAVFVVAGMLDAPQPLIHDKLYGLLICAFSRWPDASHVLACLFRDLGLFSLFIPQRTGRKDNPFRIARSLLSRLPQDDLCSILGCLQNKLEPWGGNLDGFQPLSREMLAEMIQSGITIGSHTQSHVLLTNECQCRARQELEQSRLELETKLGIPIYHFAYPDGQFNRQAVQAVAAAGYRYAYTTCRHRDPNYSLLTIPRRILWENTCLDHRGSFSPAIMNCQVNGLFDLLANCGKDHEANPIDSACVEERRKVGLAI